MALGLAEVFHLVIFAFYSSILWYDINYVGVGEGSYLLNYEGFAGKFKFLTFICFIIQTVYFGICLANDIWGTNFRPSNETEGEERSRLHSLRDNVYAALAYPFRKILIAVPSFFFLTSSISDVRMKIYEEYIKLGQKRIN